MGVLSLLETFLADTRTCMHMRIHGCMLHVHAMHTHVHYMLFFADFSQSRQLYWNLAGLSASAPFVRKSTALWLTCTAARTIHFFSDQKDRSAKLGTSSCVWTRGKEEYSIF